MKERSKKAFFFFLPKLVSGQQLTLCMYLWVIQGKRDVLDHTWANPWQACALFVSTSYTSPFSFHLVNHLAKDVNTYHFFFSPAWSRSISFQFETHCGLAADLTKILNSPRYKQLSGIFYEMQLASLAHFHIKTLSVLVSSTRGGGSSRRPLVVAFHSFRHLLILLFTFLILIPSDWEKKWWKSRMYIVQHKVAV